MKVSAVQGGRDIELGRESFSGDHFNFALAIQSSRDGSFQFKMQAAGQGKKQRFMILPFRALPQMRERLAKILAEHDGSRQIGPAPTIPRGWQNYLEG